ncbi:MAG: phosphohydrolase [Bacteroidetes bacterium]|nr:phosphohydrolase [Bacteroidota bacterium]
MQNQGLDNWERRFAAWWQSNGDHSDGSHDLGHFQRVWKAAQFINQQEGEPADPLVLLAAAYFHDVISLPKNHPQRSEASKMSAEKVGEILRVSFPDFPAERIDGVRHAVLTHSFSAGIPPQTPEAKILQDADRMEAVGAIGLARVFYTAGQLSQKLFDGADPMAEDRGLDDQRFALDHFQVKLLKLPAMMNTVAGRRMAEANADYLREFLKKINREIAGEYVDTDR